MRDYLKAPMTFKVNFTFLSRHVMRVQISEKPFHVVYVNYSCMFGTPLTMFLRIKDTQVYDVTAFVFETNCNASGTKAGAQRVCFGHMHLTFPIILK